MVTLLYHFFKLSSSLYYSLKGFVIFFIPLFLGDALVDIMAAECSLDQDVLVKRLTQIISYKAREQRFCRFHGIKGKLK